MASDPKSLDGLADKMNTRRAAQLKKSLEEAIPFLCAVSRRRNASPMDKQRFRALIWQHIDSVCNLCNALDRGQDGKAEFEKLKAEIARLRG